MRRRAYLPLVLSGLVLGPGCDSFRRTPPPEPKPLPAPQVTRDPVLAGTIGAVTYYADITPQPVRGFGVVIGLGDAGSSECPEFIRDYLVQAMGRERDAWADIELRKRFSPGELIDSPTTAVVAVDGRLPSGTDKGTVFDLMVTALPGTSTRSLAGGLLLPCELHAADAARSDQELIGARIVARAAGPVFVNPFAQTSDALDEGARRGYVLSGGQATEPRPVQLMLREPSYAMAERIRGRINERFGQSPPVAEALSQGIIALRVPTEFVRYRDEFFRLVPRLYLEDHGAFVDVKMRELTELATQPQISLEDVSLAWEGFGRNVVSHLKPLYTHGDPRVRFYAARAGLRLQDADAVAALAALAGGRDHSLALLSVAELGRCRFPQVAVKLTPLLGAPDQELRIAVYEALLNHPTPAVHSSRFPHPLDPMQLNVIVDEVKCDGAPLLYVRRTQVPRLAIFGPHVPMKLPLFYADASDAVVLNAIDESGDITLLNKRKGKLGQPIHVPPRVAELVAALAGSPQPDNSKNPRGLGLPYSQVVQILAALAKDGTIPAPIELERATVTELLGPDYKPERPETDESKEPAEPETEEAPATPRTNEPLLPRGAEPAPETGGGRSEADAPASKP